MKQIITPFIFVLLMNILFFTKSTAQSPNSNIKQGTWLGIIKRIDGKEIPFNFVVSHKNGKQFLTILNASERLLVTDIDTKDDSILIKLPFFASSLIVKQITPTNLNGYYVKNYVTRKQVIPFSAFFGVKNRFEVLKLSINIVRCIIYSYEKIRFFQVFNIIFKIC